MNYWLVKQEPESYSWDDFVKEGRAAWTGVRNYQARNNLRSMKKGDVVFYYHSGDEKQIVGLASVTREPYPDPTAEEGDWVCVDLIPIKPVTKAVTLAAIKAEPQLSEILLVRNSRLSVIPVNDGQFHRILTMSETKL